MSRTLLRSLATTRTATEPIEVRYDPVEQISYVYEQGSWVPSWQSSLLRETKKCDYETGEDQKGS